MLGETSQGLFRDVFEQPDLFAGLPEIRRRVVVWGPGAKPLSLAHSAVVVSEPALLERLQTRVGAEHEAADGEPAWTIYAARPLPPSSVEHSFGSRTAAALPVRLRAAEGSTCWIESLENGWLFLIPNAPDAGWLLAVGSEPESLLGQSRFVASQIDAPTGPPAQFPAYPRIAWPLCGDGWLSCGTAALAFDPLCGEGAGNAIREAILAAAIVRAATSGEDPSSLISDYRARLLAGFKRHLEACREFYERGRCGPWWDGELDSLRLGLEWCDRERAANREFRYQLRGFELVRMSRIVSQPA
jgi:hypothetical protein